MMSSLNKLLNADPMQQISSSRLKKNEKGNTLNVNLLLNSLN